MFSSRNFSLFLLVLTLITIWLFLPSPQLLQTVRQTSVADNSVDSATENSRTSSPTEKLKQPITKVLPPETPKNTPKKKITSLKTKRLNNNIPDFSSIKDVRLKKKTFFEFMYPKIITANAKVADERTQLKKLKINWLKNSQFSTKENGQFVNLLKKYREDKIKLDVLSKLNNLLLKVDAIPPSLILAQSANESAWGTSRFAKKGNNYFGQWCYKKGCGLVPSQRNAGATHEVAKFNDVQTSVNAYIFNINVSRSYATIRRLRQKMRSTGKTIDSLMLAKGLSLYSERGAEYVKEIQSMIRFNKLQQYD